ncbi:hypothetical protein [Paenibacillus sp. LjRoot56]|uniref:hypothetical protein n=1 Tax=Paenibacillus sp. LjRoot56 TaxID=3342333 RepID=UPI003ECE7199
MKQVRSIFYGLKPVVTGLIIYVAIHFGFEGQVESILTWKNVSIAAMAAGVFVAVDHTQAQAKSNCQTERMIYILGEKFSMGTDDQKDSHLMVMGLSEKFLLTLFTLMLRR